MIKEIILIFSILINSIAFAQSSQVNQNQPLSAEELQVQQRARKKVYPGGRDEENLKVQAQLPLATRKMAPVTEAPQEPEAADTDHD